MTDDVAVMSGLPGSSTSSAQSRLRRAIEDATEERTSRRDVTPMMLSVGVGLCAVPVVLLLVTPSSGLRAALVTALAVLAGITAICWVLCASERLRRRGEP